MLSIIIMIGPMELKLWPFKYASFNTDSVTNCVHNSSYVGPITII